MIGGVWLWFFWPFLIGAKVAGFRDSTYLYYPLLNWLDGEISKGILPIWNPFCNYGIPVVHDGTSSLFYPGKLIFLTPLPFPARYGIFLSLHVLLAAVGTYGLARTLRLTAVGSTLAALAFAFGGASLFQIHNAPFLISAAWLPLALRSVWKMFRGGRYRSAIETAIYCALMILGGDPQMCFHVGLIMCAFAFWQWRRNGARRRKRRLVIETRHNESWLGAKLITTTVLVTSLLSAVQVLPSYVWSQDSIRVKAPNPRNIWEANTGSHIADGKDAGSFGEGILVAAPMQEHANHIYQFSQPPWSLGELVWPNFSGKAFPVHQRWVDALPGAERMWTPSLYMGCLVFILALLALRPFSRHRKQAWLSRLFLFFAVASLGWYGPVWLLNEFGMPAGKLLGFELFELGPQVGGLYWMMVTFLPKYVAFRYPAKLFTIAALALALLAGWQLDRELRQCSQCRLKKAAIALGTLGVLLILFADAIALFPNSIPSQSDFGNFDSAGCEAGIWFSGLSLIVIGAACFIAVRLKTKRLPFLILAICAIDIAVANTWLLAPVRSSILTSPNDWETYDGGPLVRQFGETASSKKGPKFENRLEEITFLQRDRLSPKYHLEHEVPVLGSFYSIEPSQEFEPLKTEEDHWVSFGTILKDLNWSILSIKDTEGRVPLDSSGTYRMVVSNNGNNRKLFVAIQPIPGWSCKAIKLESATLEQDPTWTSIELKKSDLEVKGRRLTGFEFRLPKELGSYQLTFQYRPWELYLGMTISGVAWLVLVVCCGVRFLKRR